MTTQKLHLKKINEVYNFWFHDMEISSNFSTRQSALWFGHNPNVDQKIRTLFSLTMENLARKDYVEWIKSDRGLVACIVVLDQFTRNTFRGSSKMYQHDKRALELSRIAIRDGREAKLNLFEKLFLFLPFEHSERIEDQELSMALFKSLVNEQEDELRPVAEAYLLYAKKHFDVITEFGRFPHRNALLGRPSTQKELDYLKAGGGF